MPSESPSCPRTCNWPEESVGNDKVCVCGKSVGKEKKNVISVFLLLHHTQQQQYIPARNINKTDKQLVELGGDPETQFVRQFIGQHLETMFNDNNRFRVHWNDVYTKIEHVMAENEENERSARKRARRALKFSE